MTDFNDEYIQSLKDSELKMLISDRLDARMIEISSLSAEDKKILFDTMLDFVERNFVKNSKSRKWSWFFNKRSEYSIVPSDSAPEILANGFKMAIRCLGPEYYKEVQEKASKAYKKHISRKRTPAMWMLKFLAPVIFLKDLLFKKKK